MLGSQVLASVWGIVLPTQPECPSEPERPQAGEVTPKCSGASHEFNHSLPVLFHTGQDSTEIWF